MFIGPLLLLAVAPALRKIFLSRDRAVVEDSEAEAAAEAVRKVEKKASCRAS
jgi:cobalt-zinc-cadmium resistance protein CzcA